MAGNVSAITCILYYYIYTHTHTRTHAHAHTHTHTHTADGVGPAAEVLWWNGREGVQTGCGIHALGQGQCGHYLYMAREH